MSAVNAIQSIDWWIGAQLELFYDNLGPFTIPGSAIPSSTGVGNITQEDIANKVLEAIKERGMVIFYERAHYDMLVQALTASDPEIKFKEYSVVE